MNSKYRTRPFARNLRRTTATACTLAALTGCQTYTPAPLDLTEHIQSIRLRGTDGSPDAEPLAAFARSLAAEPDQPAAFNTADGIGPEEAEVLALFYNADLRRARATAGVALARAESAGLWQDPVFGFDAAEILSPASPLDFGLTLSLTIPVSGRLAVERDRADAAHALELQRVAAAEWDLRASVRTAWAAWHAAELTKSITESATERIDGAARLAEALANTGELSRIQARLFAVERAEQRGRLDAVAGDAYRARTRLLWLMGLPSHSDVVLTSGWPRFNVVDRPVLDEARLVRANQDLAIDRAAYQVSEESLRLAVREQYPDITIGTGYGSEDRDDRLLLGFSLSVPSLNANRGEIAEARARRHAARIEADATLERVIREAAELRMTSGTVLIQLILYETEIIPLLDTQIRDTDRLADLGEVDAFALLETITRTLDAKRRLVDLRLARVEARAELARLFGPEPTQTQTNEGAAQ